MILKRRKQIEHITAMAMRKMEREDSKVPMK
jgi:hypothetical protein